MKLRFWACWRILLGVVAMSAILGAGSQGSSRADAVAQVWLRTIFCEKTTEAGHDEVYAVVSGVEPGGREISKKLPGGNGDADNGESWDCNDSGDKKDRWLRYPIVSGITLKPGETAFVRISFMESDGQDWGKVVDAAGNLAASMSRDPYVKAGGGIASFFSQFIPVNQNDFLGSVLIEIKNSGDKLERKLYFSDGAAAAGEWDDIGGNGDKGAGMGPGFTVRLRGDGSNYLVYINTIFR